MTIADGENLQQVGGNNSSALMPSTNSVGDCVDNAMVESPWSRN